MFEGDYHDPVVWNVLTKLKGKIGQHACSIVARYTAAPLYQLERKLVGATLIKCHNMSECLIIITMIESILTDVDYANEILESFEIYSSDYMLGEDYRAAYNQLVELRPQIVATPLDQVHYRYIPVLNVHNHNYNRIIFGMGDHQFTVPLACRDGSYIDMDMFHKKIWTGAIDIIVENELKQIIWSKDHLSYVRNTLLDAFGRFG